MINYYPKKFSKSYILVDACNIVISYLLAYYLRFTILINGIDFFELGAKEKYYPLNVYTDSLILLVPLYLFLYCFLNLNTSLENKITLKKVLQIVLTNILGIVLFLIALYLHKEIDLSRKFLTLFFLLNVILSIGSRMLYSYCLKIIRKKQQLKS